MSQERQKCEDGNLREIHSLEKRRKIAESERGGEQNETAHGLRRTRVFRLVVKPFCKVLPSICNHVWVSASLKGGQQHRQCLMLMQQLRHWHYLLHPNAAAIGVGEHVGKKRNERRGEESNAAANKTPTPTPTPTHRHVHAHQECCRQCPGDLRARPAARHLPGSRGTWAGSWTVHRLLKPRIHRREKQMSKLVGWLVSELASTVLR